MVMDISTFELSVLGVMSIMAFGFLLFGKMGEMVLAALVIFAGVVSILYTHHSAYLEKKFVIANFEQGMALECGMFRGESVKVDPKYGWVHDKELGFVKGDKIINDEGQCTVIAQASPTAPTALYWLAYLSIIAILGTLRPVVQEKREQSDNADKESA